MWQELIVGACGVMAAVFLLRRLLGSKRDAGTECGGCRGCAQTNHCQASSCGSKQ